ncbi:MAG: class I SAM-dependent methyltransferase [Saprospiraceae bacterium]
MQSYITAYYDQIANLYDSDRFGNTYGQFIDAQERAILSQLLGSAVGQRVLDVGCGTGRFLDFATHGLDASAAMLAVARQKQPDKLLTQADFFEQPYENDYFEAAISMHVVMHIASTDLEKLLAEVHRILKPGGQFIFDFPSKPRRTLLGYKSKNWHGANAFTLSEVQALANAKWQMDVAQGILFLPIHRFPPLMRPFLRSFDTWLCRSFLKKYASYIVVSLAKR